MVVAEGGNGAVRGDQEWQHVETLHAVIAHQPCARPTNLHHLGGDFQTVPGLAIDQRFAIRPQRTLQTEETGMRA